MTYQEARGSLQLMVEERIGAVLRAQRRQEQQQDDAAWNKTREALRNQ